MYTLDRTAQHGGRTWAIRYAFGPGIGEADYNAIGYINFANFF